MQGISSLMGTSEHEALCAAGWVPMRVGLSEEVIAELSCVGRTA